MQDRFLFRGKQVKTDKWIVGTGVFEDGTNTWIFSNKLDTPIAFGLKTEIIDPATIGQCTGLKDKNGKMIFEGDIIHSNVAFHVKSGWNNWIVEWGKNEYGATGFSIVLIGTTFPHEMCIAHSKYYEIIGNIHDTAPTD